MDAIPTPVGSRAGSFIWRQFQSKKWSHHAVVLAPVQGRQHLPSSGAPVINLSFGRFERLYCHLIVVAAVVDVDVVGGW